MPHPAAVTRPTDGGSHVPIGRRPLDFRCRAHRGHRMVGGRKHPICCLASCGHGTPSHPGRGTQALKNRRTSQAGYPGRRTQILGVMLAARRRTGRRRLAGGGTPGGAPPELSGAAKEFLAEDSPPSNRRGPPCPSTRPAACNGTTCRSKTRKGLPISQMNEAEGRGPSAAPRPCSARDRLREDHDDHGTGEDPPRPGERATGVVPRPARYFFAIFGQPGGDAPRGR